MISIDVNRGGDPGHQLFQLGGRFPLGGTRSLNIFIDGVNNVTGTFGGDPGIASDDTGRALEVFGTASLVGAGEPRQGYVLSAIGSFTYDGVTCNATHAATLKPVS